MGQDNATSESNLSSRFELNTVRGRLLDAKDKQAIAYAYIEVLELKLQLASDNHGCFEFQVPENFNADSLEILIMPIYYEYKSTKINISKSADNHIYLKTNIDLLQFPSKKSTESNHSKSGFWSYLKNKLFRNNDFQYQA
jgi:hypothetical protein